MSKHLHPGKAAFNGILAADLAANGFSGATRILEGERGFFRATARAYDPTRITDGLGERWKISENCYKMHACCGHTHSAVDTALDLRSRATITNIAAIRIGTYGPGFEIVKEPNPRSAYRAQFSIAYCVAAALAEGRVGLEQFSAERFGAHGVRDAEIASLLARTEVIVDEELSAKYPAAWPARIDIRLVDGTMLRGATEHPRGNPENPVSTSELERKLEGLVAPRFGAETARQAVAAVRSLDTCDDMAVAFRDLLPARELVAS